MVWTISKQPRKSDFSRPLQGPLRSEFLESFPFKPEITFDGRWSSRFNFSLEQQVIKSKMPSQLKNHFSPKSVARVHRPTKPGGLFLCFPNGFWPIGRERRVILRNGAGRAKMPSICAFICPLNSLYATISLGATTSNINPEGMERRVCPMRGTSLFDPKGTWAFQIL